MVGNICHSSKLQTSWQFGCRRDCFNFLFADAFVAPCREMYSQNFIEAKKLVSSCGKKDVLRRFATKSYELSNIWLHNPFPTKSSYMDCQSRFVHVGLFKMDSMLSGEKTGRTGRTVSPGSHHEWPGLLGGNPDTDGQLMRGEITDDPDSSFVGAIIIRFESQ